MKPINEMKHTFLSRSANEGFARAAVAADAAEDNEKSRRTPAFFALKLRSAIGNIIW